MYFPDTHFPSGNFHCCMQQYGSSTEARMEFGAEHCGKAGIWGQVLEFGLDMGSCHFGKKNLAKLPLEKVNKIYISRCSAEFYIYDTMLLDVSAHCYDGTDDHRLEVLIFFRKKCEIFAKRFFFFAGNPTHNNALH